MIKSCPGVMGGEGRRECLGGVSVGANNGLMEVGMNAWLSLLGRVVFVVGIGWSVQGLAQTGQQAAQGKAADSDPEIIDWGAAKKQMAMLSQLGYHPFLMPLIMENRDVIGLSNAQVRVFRNWRNKYRVPLLHTMNRVLQERLAFQRISLNPKTSEEVLLAKQEEIFKLHKKVLKYQLSCRRNILDTFTDEQWGEFRFVLTENGYALD